MYIYICAWAQACGGQGTSLLKWVLSLYHVGPRDGTQVIWLDSAHLAIVSLFYYIRLETRSD